jgi:hypothetical protein
MSVKVVSEGNVLCETWAGSGIIVGEWPMEALQMVERGPPLIRRLQDQPASLT